MSTLAAVVGNIPRRIADWNSQIVSPDDPNPFSEFHAKFWGVTEVAEGDMEIDDPTAEDDDINPSCYVLDIDIEGLEDKIWVRAEYIRMFKFAEEFYAENTSKSVSPCLVITGQLGIGKFGAGALYECAVPKKNRSLSIRITPVGCSLKKEFLSNPLHSVPSFIKPLYGRLSTRWILLRARPSGSRHFVIYTTSPTPSRWQKLHQSMERAVCVMNPWTKAEIHRAAPFRAPGVSISAIDATFHELGPIPRLCFGKKRSLIQYRKMLRTALRNLTFSDLEDLSKTSEDLALDAVLHTIYMLRRRGASVDSVEMDVETISPIIASEVARRLQELKRHELVRLFKLYSALPSTRKMSGDVFEAYCHVIFSTRIEFDFVSMMRIGGRPTATEKKNPQWFSSHTEFTGSNAPQLEALRALANRASLGISPSRVVDYDSKEVARGLHIEADMYYMPVKPNQVGIDSLILHDNHLDLLKMTVTDTHGISDGLWPFLVSLKGLPPKSCWRFIFVKPPANILACPVPRSAQLWNLDLYSAEVEVK